MYLENNPVDDLIIAADSFVMEHDRMLYKPYLEYVEDFCSKNNVILGGNIGINRLINEPINKDLFQWSLYASENIYYKLAEGLTSVKSAHIPNDTVGITANLPKREYTIYVYARELLKIYIIPSYRGINILPLLTSETRPAIFTQTPVQVISPIIHLMNIYRHFYTPANQSYWANDLMHEEELYKLFISTKKTGAAEMVSRQQYSKLVLTKIIASSNMVVIGDYALAKLNLISNPDLLQIISDLDIEEIKKKLERLVTNQSVTIRVVKHHMYLINDFRLTKHTIYLVSKSQIPILEVYNASSFEMIPYIKIDDILVANPWVLLRFTLINIWVMKLISNIKDVNTNKLMNNMKILHDYTFNNDLLSWFQLDNYVGVYNDENVAKKKLIKQLGIRPNMIYPAYLGSADIDTTTTNVDTTTNTEINIDNNVDNTVDNTVGNNVDNTVDNAVNNDPLFKSQPINLSHNPGDKMSIAQKITRSKGTLLELIQKDTGGHTTWSMGKAINDVLRKNKQFAPYLYTGINTYIDIGCGSGVEVAAFKSTYKIKNAICADIEDNRIKKCKYLPYINITPGLPLTVDTESVNVVSLFHVIHHMANSVVDRIADIARILVSGGLLLVKDHDVTTFDDAANVDFEHYMYLVRESNKGTEYLMKNFPEELPMNYYSAAQIMRIAEPYFDVLWIDITFSLTRVYSAVLKKR